jgi:hypothetical protein
MRRSWVGLTALIAVTTLATAAAADAYDAMCWRDRRQNVRSTTTSAS